MTEQIKNRFAGVSAILAGLCWFVWAVVNTTSNHGLETASVGSTAAQINSLLIAGWNLLLIPVALRLYDQFRKLRPKLLLAATIAGILSFILWTVGGYTHISHTLETIYLALETIWMLAIGFSIVQKLPVFGYFTLVVGAFTALDVIFNLFEPLPFVIYLLAAPKLPLWALWSLTVGVFLLWKAKEMSTYEIIR